jgi:hypothetical protein
MEQQERAAGKTQGTNPRFFSPSLSFTHSLLRIFTYETNQISSIHHAVTKQNEEGQVT